MALYKLILAYDGTEFSGSQRQADARTVQGELEKALRRLGWRGKSVLLAGRTDAGVHASGQVAACELTWRHSPADLQNALNATLPADLAVVSVVVASNEFHPRFDATGRRYTYRIYCAEHRDPLRERYAWRVFPTLDVDAMNGLAQKLIGEHDFAAFGRPTSEHGTTVRRVYAASWRSQKDELVFEIVANAFLYHMVRHLVFSQVQVALGKLPENYFDECLHKPVTQSAQGLAPAQGLVLSEVYYNHLDKES